MRSSSLSCSFLAFLPSAVVGFDIDGDVTEPAHPEAKKKSTTR